MMRTVRRHTGLVKLRKFPYPYRAAFTILSDRHGVQTADEFRAFHRFLNTTQETLKGRGLGLEIGDTFWFFDDIGRFSYFNKYSHAPSEQAPLIRDYYSSGFIDCLHTWGDFTNVPFERKYAEWAAEEASARGISLPIWVNHGNRNNTHNINSGVEYHLGAAPKAASYHVDLARATGFRYLWRFLTPVIGQDRKLSCAEQLSVGREDAHSRALFTTRRLVKRVLMELDHLTGRFAGVYDESADNHFLAPAILDDGSTCYEFFRFNNHPVNIWHGMHVPDLLRQLRPDILDALVRSEGYMIVYNHLEYGEFYHPDIVAVLRTLAERQERGDLWITTTARLIRYNIMYHRLMWREDMDTDRRLTLVIDETIDDPILGTSPVTLRDLEGITFLVSKSVRGMTIKLGDAELSQTRTSTDGSEIMIEIPMNRLVFPE
jgi:hypothetical protein